MFELVQVNSLMLPPGDPVVPIDTGKAQSPVVELMGGGGYRVLQGSRAARGVLELRYQCAYTGATDWAYGPSLAALRGLFGQRVKLYRKRRDTAYAEWVWAEMLNNDGQNTPHTAQKLAIDCTFRVYDATWRGSHYGVDAIFDDPASIFDSGLLFDGAGVTLFALTTSPITLTLPCGGNALARAATITVTPAGTSITSITVEGMTAGVPKYKYSYTGTLPVGTQLVINTGAKSVRTLTGGVYSAAANNFALDYAAVQTTDWLYLDPTLTNLVKVTRVGGSSASTVAFDYSERSI